MCNKILYASLAVILAALPPIAPAADVTVAPASGSGFVVRNAANSADRFRVNEDGTMLAPSLTSGPAQPTPVCSGTGGLLGPCASASGASYGAGTGLALSGTTFSVAPTFQLPQSCGANQVPQWNGTGWTCAAAGLTLPYAATQTYASGALFDLTNDSASGIATAIHGTSYSITGFGVRGDYKGGSSVAAGVIGTALGTQGAGVYGYGPTTGVEAVTSSGTGLYAHTASGSTGTGKVAVFESINATNSSDAVAINNAGTGRSLTISQTNASSTATALYINTAGGTYAADIETIGNSNALLVGTNNPSSAAHAIEAFASGPGSVAVAGNIRSSGSGVAGLFTSFSPSASSYALDAENRGAGPVLLAQQTGSGGDIAIFTAGTPSSAPNVARIDRTGKGFFNGGTQTGGADVAELVPTSGAEPQSGDVVEIDPAHEDRFRLAAEANSTRVAGVISTRPGVTLNDATGAEHAASCPALALAGRVPVKVSNANGAIHVGDLLVASSVPGHAMRAPEQPALGSVIGKALQHFDAVDGSIQMLVWAH